MTGPMFLLTLGETFTRPHHGIFILEGPATMSHANLSQSVSHGPFALHGIHVNSDEKGEFHGQIHSGEIRLKKVK